MQTVLFSADLGNGYVKCKSSVNPSTSYPAAISIVSDQLSGFQLGIGRSNHDFTIGYNGVSYAVGDTVRTKGLTPITITHSSRITTDYYKVLFASALASCIWEDSNVTAIVSLPPAAYWDRDKLKAVIAGDYTVDIPGIGKINYHVPINDLMVVPEGVGAACCLALDENGYDLPGERMSNATVGIIDVGTYTTDLILLDRLHIVRSGCDTLPHALHDIHERLRTYCASEGYTVEPYMADRVLSAGYFMKGGVRKDIRRYIPAWTNSLIPAISGMIRTTWNGGDDCDHMQLVGGGAIYVYDRLAMEFAQLRILESVPPHMANVEGAYRYALLRMMQK